MSAMDGKTAEIFKRKKMPLIASLPRNSVELARAAEAGGADMLKVHINVRHTASGTNFGSFAEERGRIEEILSAVKIPVGIMPGAGVTAALDEMRELERLGIAFYDIYITDMPAEYLKLEKMEAMAALGADWRQWEPKALNVLGVRMLEASVVHHDEYGRGLAMSDLITYSYIAKKFDGAVIVPTQKAVKPEEAGLLRESGVRGLMIGKIVAGDTPETFEATAKKFADEIALL